MHRMRIMILIDWFDPAYKAGGPIRSSVNFVKQLRNDCEIYILTSDRDLNDVKAMEGIVCDKWIDYVPGVKIFYASLSGLNLRKIKELINKTGAHTIYVNSMFSKKFAIYPLWLKRTNRISSRIVLAPRGMLKSSALQFKNKKKKIFLSFFKWMRIPQLVTFHATDQQEKSDILHEFGKAVRITVIPNFPGSQDDIFLPADKQRGKLSILFIGRIHPIKGLDILLKALKQIRQNVQLTIAGNAEDISYLRLCQNIIKELPGTVQVIFANEVPHNQIVRLIRESHLFCLPTKGENFGHAIFEALSAGRPVLISDQTPWRNLTVHNAGWDVPDNSPENFSAVIEYCALMDAEELNKWCTGAWNFCNRYIRSSNIKQQYLKLFG